ncbi:sortase A [Pilibacter termitis]|uniref:Sortase A n=1 Tax=Pilibacter termitis TaxID=263852 RepID=A0A1T4MHB8_9ENTE|nr:class C sortase [Pilibacter termitis]SJZ66267.1 sortase A [Pilibacter termitis]
MNNRYKITQFLLSFLMSVSLLVGVGALCLPRILDIANDYLTQTILEETTAQQKDKKMLEEQMKNRQESLKQKALSDPYSQESLHELEYDPITVPIYAKHLLGEIYLPAIRQVLPIFDNSSDQFLQRGAAWLANSSELTGGVGKHSVVAGHSGIPHAKLFNDVPNLKQEDLIVYKISGEYLAYKVTSLQKVTPENTRTVTRDNNKDLTTLVTCVPIGVNSHRLLVTGERVDFTPSMMKEIEQIKETKEKNNRLVLIALAILFVLLFCFLLFMHFKRKKRCKT